MFVLIFACGPWSHPPPFFSPVPAFAFAYGWHFCRLASPQPQRRQQRQRHQHHKRQLQQQHHRHRHRKRQRQKRPATQVQQEAAVVEDARKPSLGVRQQRMMPATPTLHLNSVSGSGMSLAPLRRKTSMGSFQRGMGESLTGRMRKQLDIPQEPKVEINTNIPIDQITSLKYLAQVRKVIASYRPFSVFFFSRIFLPSSWTSRCPRFRPVPHGMCVPFIPEASRFPLLANVF